MRFVGMQDGFEHYFIGFIRSIIGEKIYFIRLKL